MKNIKNILFVALFATHTCSPMFPYKQYNPQQIAAAKKTIEPTKSGKNYFIHEQNSDRGIWVDKKVVEANSKSLRELIKDVGQEVTKIPLDAPIHIISLAFNILQNKVDMGEISFQDLTKIATLFNFLDVPEKRLTIVLQRIREEIENDPNKVMQLHDLHPDLQKLLLLTPVVDSLKNTIINSHAGTRNKSLIGHPYDVKTAAFSPDGTKIISGSRGDQNNLILWDITDQNNITHKPLVGHPDLVKAVAFSPDGTKIISGSRGDQNNLILWDITDQNNITHKPLVGHPGAIQAVAFSPDGTKIISGCSGYRNNLILWDITDQNNITHKVLAGHPYNVKTAAFSPDGTKIISSCYGNQNNLILWDITDQNNITHKVLAGHPYNVETAAFSPDSTKIISGSRSDQNNLILWDITDQNNITHKPLAGNSSDVWAVAFSPDGTKIISGSSVGVTYLIFIKTILTEQNTLILWDITDQNNITQKVLARYPNTVRKVAFSPDSTKIISGSFSNQNNLILWDLTDQNNITHKVLAGHLDQVYAVAFSPDGTKIILGSEGNQNNLILWILLTEQEKKLLHHIQSYSSEQLQLMYFFCSKGAKGKKITLKKGSTEEKLFMSLPADMQQLLKDLFFEQSWFSRWW